MFSTRDSPHVLNEEEKLRSNPKRLPIGYVVHYIGSKNAYFYTLRSVLVYGERSEFWIHLSTFKARYIAKRVSVTTYSRYSGERTVHALGIAVVKRVALKKRKMELERLTRELILKKNMTVIVTRR